MPGRSSSLAKSQRDSSHPDDASRSREVGLLAVRSAPNRDVARPTVGSSPSPLIPASLRDDMIRDAAYFRAQARGFAPGREIEDWLAAEQDVEDLIVRRYGR